MAGYIGKSQGVVLTDIDNNSVTTADIQDNAVTAAKLDTTYATPAYVDTAEADAVTSANSYTDTAISNIDALPDQTGQSGNYLTTDGTNASWGAVDLSSYATTTALNTAVANSSNWDTAYGWGDHSTQNYATTTGDTMTGALNFGDNVKAQFGASNDLQVFHDGSNSLVQEVGTGSLLLCGNNLALKNGDNTESYVVCANNGATSLYYNNAQKLATTSTGVSVTGSVTATNTFKAFTNFKGTGTVTNRDSFNVSSISDLGTGQYRVNFSTSIATHYCVTFVGSNRVPNLGDAGSCAIINYTDMLTTSCRVAVKNVEGASGGAIDVDVATVGFFTP